MYVPPLVPGIKMALAREHDPHAADADHAYAQKRRSILQRDGYRCVSCGFPAPPDKSASSGSLLASGYLEVHHIDNDHHNNEDEQNLITLCPFCHSVHHLGFTGANKRASLAVIPWLTQAQINLLCNLCGVAINREGELGSWARELYESMQRMGQVMEELFGPGADDASVMSGALSSLHRKNRDLYAQRGKALYVVRVIPTLSAFTEAVSWWASHTWLPGENWETAWRKLLEA